MRVFQIEGDWGIDHLQAFRRGRIRHRDRAQVLVRMKASSLNYRDLVVPDRGYGSHTGTSAADSRCRTGWALWLRRRRACDGSYPGTGYARPSFSAGRAVSRLWSA